MGDRSSRGRRENCGSLHVELVDQTDEGFVDVLGTVMSHFSSLGLQLSEVEDDIECK